MNRIFVLISLMSALLVSAASLAGENGISEKEKLHRARTDFEFSERGTSLKKKCGVEVETKIDWVSFPQDTQKYSVTGYCGNILNAVTRHCETPQKRAYIKKNLKSVTCRHHSKDKVVVEHKAQHLDFSFSLKSTNISQKARKQLLRNF